MCKFYAQDKPCPLGNRCHFSHGKAELRRNNDPLPSNLPLLPGVRQLDPHSNQPVILNNYKTIVCKYWEQGKCKYMHKCSFAHGDSDLRTQDVKGIINNGSSLDPMKVPALEYLLRREQLEMIANVIIEEERVGTDQEEPEALIKTKLAIENLKNWKINDAADIIIRWVFDSKFGKSSKSLRKQTFQKALCHAEQFLKRSEDRDIQDLLVRIFENQNSAISNLILSKSQS